jgi:hypothetical protein
MRRRAAPEEYWIQRDGTKIAVGDMDIGHLRNTLRMIIRKARKHRERQQTVDEMFCFPDPSIWDRHWDYKDASDAQAYRDLANPNVLFPLLDGGVRGSPALQAKYGKGVFDRD